MSKKELAMMCECDEHCMRGVPVDQYSALTAKEMILNLDDNYFIRHRLCPSIAYKKYKSLIAETEDAVLVYVPQDSETA